MHENWLWEGTDEHCAACDRNGPGYPDADFLGNSGSTLHDQDHYWAKEDEESPINTTAEPAGITDEAEEDYSPYYIWHEAWEELGLDVMSLFIWSENGESRFAIHDRDSSRDDGTGKC